MGTIDHAKREFLKLGYNPIDECEDDPNKWIQENVLELLEVFVKQGHSGSSAPYVINLFKKLANQEPVAPIMCTDDEWYDVEDSVFQNNRCGAVFKDDLNGNPYYLDAIVFVDENDSSFTGSAYNKTNDRITSRQHIKLPFTTKTFYVDVVDYNDEHYIKDESQLNAVWEYYEHQETKSYIRLLKLKALYESR